MRSEILYFIIKLHS